MSSLKKSYRFLQVEKDGIIFLFIYLRQRCNLSPGQIAKGTRISETTIRNWEFGNTLHPQHETIRRALEFMGWKESFNSGDDRIHFDYERRRVVDNGRSADEVKLDLGAKKRPKIKPTARFEKKVQVEKLETVEA